MHPTATYSEGYPTDMARLACITAVLAGLWMAHCVDLEGAKQSLINEMNAKFTRCEEKIDALADRLTICEEVLNSEPDPSVCTPLLEGQLSDD